MKLKNIMLSIALIGTMNVLMANDEGASSSQTKSSEQTQTQTQQSGNTVPAGIDEQIAKIQAAPEAERVKLMNQFKQQLMQMNQNDRMAAISAMQEKMRANGNRVGTEAEMRANETMHMAQEHMQEHVQEMQMQTTQRMNQMQQMTQQQVGDQIMHMPTHDQAIASPMMNNGGAGSSNMNMINMSH